jgi:hypothetical protein
MSWRRVSTTPRPRGRSAWPRVPPA